MKRLLSSFLDLIFPRCCEVCGETLVSHEKLFCTTCRYKLPQTMFWLDAENKAAKLFWGRVKVENVSAFFFYNKRSTYSKLLHKLKYKGRKDIGIELGRWYGSTLVRSPLYSTVDIIIPVPLHAKRLKKRGYNQSEQICIGLSETMKKPVEVKILLRKEYTETQTRKNRIQRWQNVENVFELANAEQLQGKHILLVDDVLTTGATLEACAVAIHSAADCKLSIATLAIADLS